jgi:hypothetical protein
MPLIRSKEHDSETARRIAQEGTILRAVVGSQLHGLNNPGTDDRDEMAVCVEPREYVLGLREFEHFVYRTQGEGQSSGPGDLDLVVYGLRKYCRLALKGSPTVLLLLFARGEHVVASTAIGERLQKLAPAFVSRRAGRAFLGYLDAQRRGLVGQRHTTRTRERSAEHGYDTKYAMHALRIGHQGHEFLANGTITLPVAEPARTMLLSVRRGEPTLDEVIDELHSATARLEHALVKADVPGEPDTQSVDRFLVAAYEEAWATG